MLLSGGQKSRLALARAVYRFEFAFINSDADVYVFDDPLSAVDATVGRRLYENCIKGCLLSPTPIGSHRTKPAAVLLITHQLQYIAPCNQVLVLRAGKVVSCGSFEDAIQIRDSNSGKDDFISSMRQFLNKGTTTQESTAATDVPKVTPSVGRDAPEEVKELVTTDGHISFSTYVSFFRSGASITVITFMILVLIAGQIAYIMTDFYLSLWANQSPASQVANGQINAAIYSSLVTGTVLISAVRAEVFFLVALRCSSVLYEKMLKTVIRSPMAFFEAQSHGRLLNRFSKDTGLIDEMLPLTFYDLLQGSFQLLGTFGNVILI